MKRCIKIGNGKVVMKFLVTGINGQLGYDVAKEIVARGYDIVGTVRRKIEQGRKIPFLKDSSIIVVDITDEGKIKSVIKEHQPDIVIHCAAWTAVDAAEDDENVSKVFAINVLGTRYIAESCKEYGCKLVYISTDYVFDGNGVVPWMPDSKDCHPISIYGQSKLEGELIVSSTLREFFIIRISWAFGINGNNFVKTMIDAGKHFDEVRVVNDQFGAPTYTRDVSRLIIDMCETEKYGYYHATNEGAFISWYDYCLEIYRLYGLKTKVIPVSTVEYGLNKAQRPSNGRLDTQKLIEQGFQPLPNWKDAVRRFLLEADL